jgi:hypothetical protein
MTLGSLILVLWSRFFTTFRVLWTSVSTSTGPHRLILLSMQMLIGRDALTHASPPPAMRCFLGTISPPGHPNAILYWYIVIKLVLSASPPTRSSISEPTMSRLIYTSSEIDLPSVKFAYYMYPLHPSMLMSSLKVCRRQSSLSLSQVLVFAVLPVPTAGECWTAIGLMSSWACPPGLPTQPIYVHWLCLSIASKNSLNHLSLWYQSQRSWVWILTGMIIKTIIAPSNIHAYDLGSLHVKGVLEYK